jgi:hypothetical protein
MTRIRHLLPLGSINGIGALRAGRFGICSFPNGEDLRRQVYVIGIQCVWRALRSITAPRGLGEGRKSRRAHWHGEKSDAASAENVREDSTTPLE